LKTTGGSWTLDLRSALGLVAVGALGLAIGGSRSVYSGRAIIGVLLALAAALGACSLRGERRILVPERVGRFVLLLSCLLLALGTHHHSHEPKDVMGWIIAGALVVMAMVLWGKVHPRSTGVALLTAIALLLTGKALLWNQMLFGEVGTGLVMIRLAALGGFGLVAASLCLDLGHPRGQGRAFGLRLGLLFLTGALLRFGAVIAAPEPVIDVYSWLHHAPRHLLDGRNPYSVAYPNPYSTVRGLQYGLAAVPTPRHELTHLAVYPPLPIVLALPFTAAGVDVRYANVFCDLVAAAILFLGARRRGSPLIGALACAIYLHMPRVAYMMENAWFEPMLAAALGTGLLLAERGSRAAGLLLGLSLSGKQFGLAMVPTLWATHRKKGWLLLPWCGLGAALLVLPFFLWGPGPFYGAVITSHLGQEPDVASLTLRSAAHHVLGLDVPGPVMLGLAALLVAWISWRGQDRGTGGALWLGASLLSFCLCFVKGYFNYFYLCEYLLLLGSTALAADADAAIRANPVAISCQPLALAA
jgi:Glycosyltransferase family 87